MSLKRYLVVPMLALGLFCGSAQATVVLDNFGSPTFSLALDNGQSLAVRFELSAPTRITSIATAINNIDGLGSITLGIMASVSDEFAQPLPSGTLIHSRSLSGKLTGATLSNLDWTLGAGVYWLTGSALNANAAWFSGFIENEIATANGNGTWVGGRPQMLSPSSLIEGTVLAAQPVPEPETYALLLAGVALVGFAARRKRAA